MSEGLRAGDALADLEDCIGHAFLDKALLHRALTHRSTSVNAEVKHMERLEFLGDAVLGLVVSEFLHASYPDKPEGELSLMRSALVRKESLLDIAAQWHVANYLCVGEGERAGHNAGAIKSPSIAANAVEAVIGAVFEDAGWAAAQAVVRRAWKVKLADIGGLETRDAKSCLQELTQAKGWGLPEYEGVDFGVGASPRFESSCRVNGKVLGSGRGTRKKQAESAAAEQAYRKLKI